MRMGSGGPLIVGPQIVFQVLTEFQQHYAADREIGLVDLFVVNVFDDGGTVRLMRIGGVR